MGAGADTRAVKRGKWVGRGRQRDPHRVERSEAEGVVFNGRSHQRRIRWEG